MTASGELLADALDRIRDGVTAVLADLDRDDLRHQVAAGANPVGWLVWHLLRVQDDHVADVAGTEQVWTAGGWHERLAVPYPAGDTGYGHTAGDVAALDIDPGHLLGYAGAVIDASHRFVSGLSDDDLDRVVDEAWDPPVTLGVRLVSVVEDDLKHLGQAEYLRGLL